MNNEKNNNSRWYFGNKTDRRLRLVKRYRLHAPPRCGPGFFPNFSSHRLMQRNSVSFTIFKFCHKAQVTVGGFGIQNLCAILLCQL